ncbi:uncharacterized protein ARMOST_06064 [Armillaria ostoyae]|uniref:Uncharacterized protein n=1 Tax=Armillaria ostoyae TaxID=47428 RepID=A0A284R1Z7_ARMOS|nr:uncharacterized protein ARMOST_06064 [Armillaria ostoyae]
MLWCFFNTLIHRHHSNYQSFLHLSDIHKQSSITIPDQFRATFMPDLRRTVEELGLDMEHQGYAVARNAQSYDIPVQKPRFHIDSFLVWDNADCRSPYDTLMEPAKPVGWLVKFPERLATIFGHAAVHLNRC